MTKTNESADCEKSTLNPPFLPPYKKKRVAAYCRVSSLMEEQELSFEAQSKYYEVMLGRSPDKELICVYGDAGKSGLQADKRPAFQAMIAACRQGKIDEIYTKSVSRFARNYSECLEYARELKCLGVCIYFEKETFSTFDENIEMYFGVMAILAQEESNSISQTVTWAIRQRQRRGDPPLPSCYGYRRDSFVTDGIHKWHIVEPEAERIRLIFRLYLSGETVVSIVKKLKAYENKKGTNTLWTYEKIDYILKNVAYIGDLHCGKTYTLDYLSKRKKENHGERECYYICGHHAPIISKEDFEKAQARRSKRGGKRCK